MSSFDKKKACVGVIGQGFVGGAMRQYFEHHKMRVIAYDKYKTQFGPLSQVIKEADVVFVCVPTPMRETGECYTGIVQDVLADVIAQAQEVGRPLDSFVVCLKSTVPPGFTDKMRELYKLRLVFSPEFLTEKNAVNDMLTSNRIVVGGPPNDVAVVLRYFFEADQDRIEQEECVLVQCGSSEAEMSKLFANGLLFTKVVFSNEIYRICEKLGISYDEVAFLTKLDPRIGGSHMQVPGHDGDFGAGGHCFPKDMNDLKFVAGQLGTGQKMFSAVLERNAELRKNRDWEDMSDRAVTKK